MKPAKRTLQQEVEAAVVRLTLKTLDTPIGTVYFDRAPLLRAIRRVFAKRKRRAK